MQVSLEGMKAKPQAGERWADTVVQLAGEAASFLLLNGGRLAELAPHCLQPLLVEPGVLQCQRRALRQHAE